MRLSSGFFKRRKEKSAFFRCVFLTAGAFLSTSTLNLVCIGFCNLEFETGVFLSIGESVRRFLRQVFVDQNSFKTVDSFNQDAIEN